MSKAMQLVGIILLGIFTLVIINLMNDARSTHELDYYLAQEVTEASMYDAVDLAYYRETGLLKVDRDMFLESFNRRLAQSISGNRDYDIRIIDFNETPPKVSIEIKTNTIASVNGEVASIIVNVDGIIESIYDKYVMSVPLSGSSRDDDEPPVIEVGTDDIITFSDNAKLNKYCIGHVMLGTKKVNNTKDIKNLTCYNVIDKINDDGNIEKNVLFDGQKEISGKIEFNHPEGMDSVIMAYDRAGNISIVVLGSAGPAVDCSLDNRGRLVVNAQGRQKPTEAILVWSNLNTNFDSENYSLYSRIGSWNLSSNRESARSKWKAQLSVDVSLQKGNNAYVVYVKDANNNISMCKMTAEKFHPPAIFVDAVKDNDGKEIGKFNIKFTDDDGNDLFQYAINTSSVYSDDINWLGAKDNTSFTAQIDYSNEKYTTTYYAHVRDKKFNHTTYPITVKVYPITTASTVDKISTPNYGTPKDKTTTTTPHPDSYKYDCGEVGYTYNSTSGKCEKAGSTTNENSQGKKCSDVAAGIISNFNRKGTATCESIQGVENICRCKRTLYSDEITKSCTNGGDPNNNCSLTTYDPCPTGYEDYGVNQCKSKDPISYDSKCPEDAPPDGNGTCIKEVKSCPNNGVLHEDGLCYIK